MSFGAAGLFALYCSVIKVDPLQRIGQVSALSSMGLMFTILALLLVGALVVAARVRGGAGFDRTASLVCAAIAGLATGMVAGGIVVALHGTPWGLNGHGGDAGVLIEWTNDVRRGNALPPAYPPLSVYMLGWYADLFGTTSATAVKHMQIVGTALVGPILYLSWRLLLRPIWALAIGVVAALPLIDTSPYAPYANGVLMVLIPLLVWFFDVLRRADEHSIAQLARRGAAFGGAVGVLCLMYSGWFQWSAPGVLVVGLVLFPWRRAPRPAAILCGAAVAMFLAVAGRYLYGALTQGEGIVDNYIYFDVNTDPAYVAMYRGDLPGAVGMWPPLGELAGVGLFTVLMAIGLGASIALGRARTLVITVGSILGGCFLFRFWYAHLLWHTKLVQLYPRTTPEILYCLLILTGYAVHLAVERRGKNAESPSVMIGALCGLMLVFGSAGSAISDHYMPNNDRPVSPGWLAWQAHHQP